MTLGMAGLCSWLRGGYDKPKVHCIRTAPQVVVGIAMALLSLLCVGNSRDALGWRVPSEDAPWARWTLSDNLRDIPAVVAGFTRHSAPHMRAIDTNVAIPIVLVLYALVFGGIRVGSGV